MKELFKPYDCDMREYVARMASSREIWDDCSHEWAYSTFDEKLVIIAGFYTYALDRMANVVPQDETYRRDERFDMAEMFDGTYGVSIEGKPVESIWLKVDAYQANCLRSLPLDPSQVELRRDENHSLFSVRLRTNHDLMQKLLSFGDTVEVVNPESLRNEMWRIAQSMALKYQEENDEP